MWELLVYPGRHELSHRDVVLLLLDQYPVVDPWWRPEGTGDAYLRLVDQRVPGGLVALNALHPAEHYLTLWRAGGVRAAIVFGIGAALTLVILTNVEAFADLFRGELPLPGRD